MSNILLIEDNEANQDLITRYLTLFDHSVFTAGDGVEGAALAFRERDAIDLILLDMNLPEVDGWTLASHLKSTPYTAELPIIALTAHAMVGDREKTLAAGCDDYVSKPIDFKILLEKIEQYIHKART